MTRRQAWTDALTLLIAPLTIACWIIQGVGL